MTDNTQPEALKLADEVDEVARTYPDMAEVSAELRRQHARIAELEAQLESIGAGGVSGPLMGRASIAASAGEVVAYLDIGAGGYLELGSELSEDALQQLPKGRHALVIAGTYGIDGYVAAPSPPPEAQPAPAAGITVEQVEDAIGLQSTAWDTIDAKKIVEAVLRLANGQAPAGAGEAAEHYRNAIARACEGWTMPDGLRKHLETALWTPPTPQPTQPQAVAVPLTCEWTHNDDDGFWETAC